MVSSVRQGRHKGKRKLTVRGPLIIVKSSYQPSGEAEQSRGWGFGQLTLSAEHWGLYLLYLL